MEDKKIEEAIRKAKEIVEKMNLDEPYKSTTYKTLLENFLMEPSGSERHEEKYVEKEEKYPTGLQGRILELKNKDDFFIQKRTAIEIQKNLAEKGFIYEESDIRVGLLRLVRKGMLRRIREVKNGKETFAYVAP